MTYSQLEYPKAVFYKNSWNPFYTNTIYVLIFDKVIVIEKINILKGSIRLIASDTLENKYSYKSKNIKLFYGGKLTKFKKIDLFNKRMNQERIYGGSWKFLYKMETELNIIDVDTLDIFYAFIRNKFIEFDKVNNDTDSFKYLYNLNRSYEEIKRQFILKIGLKKTTRK